MAWLQMYLPCAPLEVTFVAGPSDISVLSMYCNLMSFLRKASLTRVGHWTKANVAVRPSVRPSVATACNIICFTRPPERTTLVIPLQ